MDDGGDLPEQLVVVDFADDQVAGLAAGQGQVGPSGGDDGAAPGLAGGPSDVPGHVGRHLHAAEAEVHRRFPGVQEGFKLGAERAFVGQDPCAGLNDAVARWAGPGGQDGVHGQPRRGGEDVAAHVIDRGQPCRCPVPVERGSVHIVEAVGRQLK